MLVHVLLPGEQQCDAYGEVLEIFQICQALRNRDLHAWFARMRWFKPFEGATEEIWKDMYMCRLIIALTNHLQVKHLVFVYGSWLNT